MKHFGDITKLNGTELPIVDIITGGSPCQDLSVAGKRAGLAGERSGLFMDQIRIIKEMRDEDKRRRCGITGADEYIQPRYMVWENVPGAFSSNKGEDFRAVLEETAKVADENAVIPEPPKGKWTHAGCIVGNGWSIAWRVHDAQWWGVPQRRKRICLLADFNGDSAGRILFELRRKTADGETVKTISNPRAERRQEVLPQSKGLSGDITESGEAGQTVAGDVEGGFGATGRAIAFEPGAASRVGGHVYEDGVCGTVRANAGDNQQAVVYGISAYESNAMKSGNPNSGIYEAETARTLDLNGGNPGCNQGGMAVVHCVDQGGGKSQCGVSEDVSPTLATTHGGEPVVCIEGNGQRESHKGDGYKESDTMYTLNTVEQHAVCIENHPADSRVKVSEDGIVQTLSSRMGTGGGNVPMVMESMQEKVGAQVARGPGAVYTEGGQNETTTRNKILRLLQETYGEETIFKWGVTVLDALQSSEILQQRVHEGSVQSEAKNREELDGSTLPCPSVVAEWLLRDMRQREECGCSPQGRKSTEQRFEQSDESMPELSQQNSQTCKEMFDMWEKGEGLWLLREALSEIQKIWKSANGQRQSVYGCSIVRRLTPLEAERLQGYPVVRKVRFTEMTKDEYIAWNINEGNIVVDTEYGKVFATRGPGGIKLDEPRELTGTILNGYRVVSIRNGDTKMQCRVHRIVWIAERGVIPDGYVIDHINNDKQDNRLCNLQLLTPKENSTKARADGLYKIHGEAGQSKITDEVHDFIQYVYGNTDLSIRQLSEIFGISKSRVHQIIHDEAWTNIGEWVDSKGKKHKDADSPRYKALGNSIALPFWQYLADKMCAYLNKPTMASLFDGIGGFPLVFTRAGAKAVWGSEVDEFCIAVSKKHFPDNEYTVAISYLESGGL